MAIHKTAGAKFYIGPVINPDELNALTDVAAVAFFEAIPANSWVQVEEVEDMGDHGDSAEAITFTAVSNRRVRKLKGAKDAGTKNIVVGRDPLDDGQVAMAAAEGTDFNYAFKTVHADARTAGYTDSVDYFGGMVMSKATQQGTVNTVTRRTFPVGINTPIYEVLSELVSS
jgi:hypothetical protein